MRNRLTIIGLLCFAALSARPQAARAECTPFKETTKLQFKFKGTLEELAQVVGKVTCKTMEIPKELRSIKISLDPNELMTAGQIWKLFVQTMWAYNVPIDVRPVEEARKLDKKQTKKIDWKSRIAQGVKKTGEGSYTIQRKLVEDLFDGSDEALRQVRLVPAIEGGQIVGIKLYAVRPGSVYAAIGLKNGDVVKRIHDAEIDSIQKVLELYARFKKRKSIAVEVIRRGKAKRMNYTFVEP